MKKQYFLHRQNEPMQTDTVVYHVWAGETIRDQRALASLMAWAFQNSATLRSWEEDIDFYLQIERERVFIGSDLLDFGFVRADISVHEALKLAQADSWDSFEKNLSQPKVFFSLIRTADPSRLDEKSRKISPSPCLSHPRKNLSERSENGRFIISFV